jgi:hypothetical protein
MAISGAQPAYKLAQGAVLRAGTSRANVTTPQVFIAIAGVQVATAPAVPAHCVLADTLTITETQGPTPNTATFTAMGFQPTDGQDVVITLGSINNLDRQFGGTILTDAHGYVGTPANYNERVSVTDYGWLLTRRTITQRFTGATGTAIAQAIIAQCPGFTSLLVQAGLPVIPVITFDNATLAAALSALATAVNAALGVATCTWKATYTKDVRFGTTAPAGQTDPTVLTPAAALLTGMEAFVVTRDLTQVITRQPVEGAGSTAATFVGALEPAPLTAPTLTLGVGPGLCTTGAHQVAVSYVRLDGETPPGPLSAPVTVVNNTINGTLLVTEIPPGGPNVTLVKIWMPKVGTTSPLFLAGTAAPGVPIPIVLNTAANPTVIQTSVPHGVVTGNQVVVTNSSRSAPPINGTWVATVVDSTHLSVPAAVTVSGGGGTLMRSAHVTLNGADASLLLYAPATNTTGQVTTLPVASSAVFTPLGGIVVSGPQRITYSGLGPWFAPTAPGPWTGVAPPTNDNYEAVVWAPALGLFIAIGASWALTSPDGVTWTAHAVTFDAWNSLAWSPTLGLVAAVSSAGPVMTSPDGVTWTARTPAGTTEAWTAICWSPALALFVAVGTKVTSYAVMTSPDGITWTGRTAAVPTAAWTGVVWASGPALFVAYSNSIANAIMTSPDGITWTQQTGPASGRNLAYSPPLNLLVALEGTATDTSPDGVTWTHHAATLPSAFWFAVIWVDAGWFVATSSVATSLIAISRDGVAWTTVAAPSASNWRGLAWAPAIGTLVGVGSTAGSIGTVMVTTAPVLGALTGIPASGPGAILYPITAGDPVTLRVVVDDLTAQAALTALMLPTVDDGIVEGAVITDPTLTGTEAIAAATAVLALKSEIAVSCAYTTRDLNTRVPRTIGVNLPAPTSVVASFPLQQVTITGYTPARWPTRAVQAAAQFVTLQDLFRQAGG